MHSLTNKVNRDAHFGKDPEFREFMRGGGDFPKSDSVSSTTSSSEHSIGDRTIVDLDLIVEKWISYIWDRTRSSKTNKIDFEDLDIIVNWAKVDLTQEEAKFEPQITKTDPANQTLFRTYFTNRTDSEQQYSFKTERVTRQICGFTFMKGFSKEKEATVTFKIPQEIVEIGGGIKSEQVVECGKDQSKEEEVSWSVDSIIKVQPRSRTQAELVITEIQLERSFSLNTYLKGRLSVTLNSRKDNSFVKALNGDIVEIIELAADKYWLSQKSCSFEIVNHHGIKYVKASLKGKCKFRLGIEQHVTLNEEKFTSQ